MVSIPFPVLKFNMMIVKTNDNGGFIQRHLSVNHYAGQDIATSTPVDDVLNGLNLSGTTITATTTTGGLFSVDLATLPKDDDQLFQFDPTNGQWTVTQGSNNDQSGDLSQGVTMNTGTNILTIFGVPIDLSIYLDDTDEQLLNLNGNDLQISNGNTVDLSFLLDNTDAQSLTLNGNVVEIDNGNSIDLSFLLDNTDAQIIGLNGNILEISNGNTVDLSFLLDNTDAQSLTLNGNAVEIDNGNSIDLSFLLDNTDAQILGLNGYVVEISNGNTVDLQPLFNAIIDKDEQKLSLNGFILEISNGNTVDLKPLFAAFTDSDDQNINLVGTLLSIEDGNNVDLLQFLDNTDEQELKLVKNELEISGGNKITIPVLKGGYNQISTRTGWWEGWTPTITANSGTVTNPNWFNVGNAKVSPDEITDLNCTIDLGNHYFLGRRCRYYFWIDVRLLINGVAVYTKTYDKYLYNDWRNDTNPDVIRPVLYRLEPIGGAIINRLNVPALATVQVQARTRYNVNAMQTSGTWRYIGGLRSNTMFSFMPKQLVTLSN